jgi:ethanolamine utilization protein EutA
MAERVHQTQFTAPDRAMGEEDRILLTSVGVDIGSSTSHLLFSRLELEREDNRYVVTKREVLHQSEILFTPYVDQTTIDGAALGRFIHEQYQKAEIRREDVDTGALILTGVALLRQNARAIGELFAEETGRFVAVSAGDNLETTMAAHGSGAVARTDGTGLTILNVDVGGGTSKLALCREGRVEQLAAMDVGARLVVADERGTITRLEPAGALIGKAVGLDLAVGTSITQAQMRQMADYMADRLFEAICGDMSDERTRALMRTPALAFRLSEGEGQGEGSAFPLSLGEGQGEGVPGEGISPSPRPPVRLSSAAALGGRRSAVHLPLDGLTFSGGVSEFVYGREPASFGDLGQFLAEALRQRVQRSGIPLLEPAAGIRATVIGASQYTIQVSGSTIFLSPLDVVPLRNIPVVAPSFPWNGAELDPQAVKHAVRDALRRFDLSEAESPVALAFRWQGLATYRRIDAFCAGAMEGMRNSLNRGHPLVLVSDGDIGGLLGLHVQDHHGDAVPIVSIDGVELREFDYIDIGSLIPSSGAVPVVIKSLVFPASAAQRV